MSYAARIIERFGGIRPMAAAIQVPASTVQWWKQSGRIPAKRQQAVLEVARRRGIELNPDDFFEAA